MRRLEALHNQTRERLTTLVAGLGDTAATTVVPACPEWTVHAVVSHLTGLCDDVLAGRVEGATTDAWTQAQVDARNSLSTRDVLDEWAVVGPKLAATLDDFPGWYGDQICADLTLHWCDVEVATGQRPEVPDGELRRALELLLSGVVHPGGEALGIGPLRVLTTVGSWTVGGPKPTDATSASAAIDAAILHRRTLPPDDHSAPSSVAAPAYELFRALTGRRSLDQIRAFTWSVDPEPYLPLFGLGPFRTRDSDLVE